MICIKSGIPTRLIARPNTNQFRSHRPSLIWEIPLWKRSTRCWSPRHNLCRHWSSSYRRGAGRYCDHSGGQRRRPPRWTAAWNHNRLSRQEYNLRCHRREVIDGDLITKEWSNRDSRKENSDRDRTGVQRNQGYWGSVPSQPDHDQDGDDESWDHNGRGSNQFLTRHRSSQQYQDDPDIPEMLRSELKR